jgi:predicted dehydrogenase
MINIAVIGYGYWGPNIVRNFSRLEGVNVSWVVDVNPKTLKEIPLVYPTIKTTTQLSDILNDATTTAVVIVTPPVTHYALATRCLKHGKHVLVEKPLTQTVAEARKLIALAKKQKKILMVDHTFIYTPAVRYMYKLIRSGALGTLYYIDSVRTNLGLLQKNSNVVHDLAVHDFSIIDYLCGQIPRTVTATGYFQKEIKQETVAYITAAYPNNLFMHCHVSWMSPIKIRRMIFVGTKKMAIYDDIEPSEKIKIYDKGVSFIKDPLQARQLRIGYRNGDVLVPNIPIEEGLFGMAKEFIHAINTKKKPITDGLMGLRVVSCITKATESLRHNGKSMRI